MKKNLETFAAFNGTLNAAEMEMTQGGSNTLVKGIDIFSPGDVSTCTDIKIHGRTMPATNVIADYPDRNTIRY